MRSHVSLRAPAHNLGPVERIPVGEGRMFEIGSRRVAVFRARTGALFATQAECPHRRGPLSDGTLGGSTLACPLHGRRWDLATGAPVDHDGDGIATYRVELSPSGEILLHIRQD
jgi:nitrite reductase (NADH) small subunit